MAKKESRISINKLEGMLNTLTASVPLPGDPNVEVKIKHNLSLNEMLQFVENVVSSCVDAESGKFYPEIMWFSIYSSVLTMYTNFNLPSNVEKQYELIYNTDAVELVMGYINRGQYEEIVDAIRGRIDHERKMMENALFGKMSDLVERMTTYAQQSDTLFGSVDSEDMSSLVRNLANIGKIDEDKLIHALIESRRNERADAASQDASSTPVKNGTVLTLPRTT